MCTVWKIILTGVRKNFDGKIIYAHTEMPNMSSFFFYATKMMVFRPNFAPKTFSGLASLLLSGEL